MFKHLDSKIDYELKATTTDSGRLYETPEGDKVPSVTTVLGYRSRESIQKWRERVGEEEANRISRQAAGRGTKVHYMAEDYLNNKEIVTDGIMPHIIQMWKSLQKGIDGHIDNVYAQEVPLYSKELKLAGRVDCIAEHDGELAIIDFKTSSKIKKRKYISNYFMQGAAYACMYAERTGIKINKIVILMTVEGEDTPLVFIEKTNDWVDKLIEEVTYYYEHNNI
tara:strand:- start:1754 stop:2422 length:669 start_codon:yes stop_codon:yes gene_type:complete